MLAAYNRPSPLPIIFAPFGDVAMTGKTLTTAASSRKSTPDSDASASPSLESKPAGRLPGINWDPAQQLLLLMGMKELPMVPGWEFASTVSLKPTP